jgi:hypothetical protein
LEALLRSVFQILLLAFQLFLFQKKNEFSKKSDFSKNKYQFLDIRWYFLWKDYHTNREMDLIQNIHLLRFLQRLKKNKTSFKLTLEKKSLSIISCSDLSSFCFDENSFWVKFINSRKESIIGAFEWILQSKFS